MNIRCGMTGGFDLRLARGGQAQAAALALRAAVFRAGGNDRDGFDARAHHLSVCERLTGRPVVAARILLHADGKAAAQGYAGRFYGLGRLGRLAGPVAEVGRFCVAPGAACPAAGLRMALGALTGLIVAQGVGTLIGCASLPGADARCHADALRHLAQRHALPAGQQPAVVSPRHLRLRPVPAGDAATARPPNLPPLLRMWLAMGARVSDHAVIDEELDTTHLFVRLDASRIPAARRRALLRLAAAVARHAAPAGAV